MAKFVKKRLNGNNYDGGIQLEKLQNCDIPDALCYWRVQLSGTTGDDESFRQSRKNRDNFLTWSILKPLQYLEPLAMSAVLSDWNRVTYWFFYCRGHNMR